MASNVTKKQVHVSPGIYFSESELSVATKSLGITHLGVVGETKKGPAFQPMQISTWSQFQTYFGGTSTEKFRGSQYPKYELPYIAKTYLGESQNLSVCRVLGLSGVNAGPAWFITAWSTEEGAEYSDKEPMIVAVIRSRGEHKKATFIKKAEPENGICDDVYAYDNILYYAKNVKIVKSKALTLAEGCSPGFSEKENQMTINNTNYGTFGLEVTLYDDTVKTYSVTFNSGEKNYIMNLLGEDPENGETEIYVEELYDIALQQLIEQKKLTTLGSPRTLPMYNPVRIVSEHESVVGIMSEDESLLKKKDVGKRYLYSKTYSVDDSGNALKIHKSTDSGSTWESVEGEEGHIYTVIAYTTSEGTREYYYGEYEGKEEFIGSSNQIATKAESGLTKEDLGKKFIFSSSSVDAKGNPLNVHITEDDGKTWVAMEGQENHIYTVVRVDVAKDEVAYYYGEIKGKEEIGSTEEVEVDEDNILSDCVYVMEDGLYYVCERTNGITPITLDMNNYKEQYRYSSTPWIVSEMKGSANHIELNKLFRFHTISDGANSINEVKISIENIDPELGTFDVIVRDFSDTDASPIVIERYRQCNLVPGTENYIALKIGSFDEAYESKSKYITVEVIENEKTKVSVPAGFLGYPTRNYNGYGLGASLGEVTKLKRPYFKYNTNVDDDVRIKKQYFGMSDLVGIDTDVLKYKGVEAYNDLPEGLTPCFHLDSRIFSGTPDQNGVVKYKGDNTTEIEQTVSVDGVTGYEWVTVGKGNTLDNYGIEPRFGSESIMVNTIYEDKRYRKFTLCFYGGFDGWDYYRTSRSNGDEYKYQKYRGKIDSISGEGTNFSIISDSETYGFDKADKIITSDYYAYLSAIRQFANPKETDINVFATPGIDYVNQNLLVQETIEMIEDERADSIYVITTPDKPFGASDSKSEMYTAEEAVDNLESSEIDTNWGCTYYPWVKYYDSTNSQYIYLPPTRDVVKNMAYTDNTTNPWFAPSGWNRGLTDGIRSRKNLILSEQDELYSGRINFINNFADEGMRIWGNNNLQVAQSNAHMNKISTRRCLIRLRKLISVACIGLIFEPNDSSLVASFRSAVQPILEDMIAKRGLVDAKLVIDDSQESLDRLELNAQLYLKFTPTLEYINIGLVATPNGVSFDDI